MDTVVANDFQDWELLNSSSDSESAPRNSFDGIDSGGLIQVDYFSVDRADRVEDVDDASAESENPGWIDPGLEEGPKRFLHKESAEFWSDSSSERSSNGKIEMGFSDNENKKFCSEIEVGSSKVDEFVEISPVSPLDSVNLDKGINIMVQGSDRENDKTASEVIERAGESSENNKRSGGAVERRGIVWWKMPIEFLKYCVFKMSPTWTVSVAAAVVGFVILGRRLSKMKKKAKGLQINVAVDDKKVSQVMSRAARLNEAFSIVKRVPVVRPSLPAVGSNPWPVMSLR